MSPSPPGSIPGFASIGFVSIGLDSIRFDSSVYDSIGIDYIAFDSIGFEDSSQLTSDIFSEILLNLFTSSTVQLTVCCPPKLGTAEHVILGYLGFFQSNQLQIGENLLSKCLPQASVRIVSKMLKALGKQLSCHNFNISIRPEHLDMLSNTRHSVQRNAGQERIIH